MPCGTGVPTQLIGVPLTSACRWIAPTWRCLTWAANVATELLLLSVRWDTEFCFSRNLWGWFYFLLFVSARRGWLFGFFHFVSCTNNSQSSTRSEVTARWKGFKHGLGCGWRTCPDTGCPSHCVYWSPGLVVGWCGTPSLYWGHLGSV